MLAAKMNITFTLQFFSGANKNCDNFEYKICENNVFVNLNFVT